MTSEFPKSSSTYKYLVLIPSFKIGGHVKLLMILLINLTVFFFFFVTKLDPASLSPHTDDSFSLGQEHPQCGPRQREHPW